VHSILQSQFPRRDGDEGIASDDRVSLLVTISIAHDSISTVITVSLLKQSDSSLPPRFFLTLFSPPLPFTIQSYPTLSYPILCHLILSPSNQHYEFGLDNFLNSDTRDGFPTRTLSAMASAVLKSCLNCSLSVRILFVYVFNMCDFFLPSAALIAKSRRRKKQKILQYGISVKGVKEISWNKSIEKKEQNNGRLTGGSEGIHDFSIRERESRGRELTIA
jgi:hypothetical protein